MKRFRSGILRWTMPKCKAGPRHAPTQIGTTKLYKDNTKHSVEDCIMVHAKVLWCCVCGAYKFVREDKKRMRWIYPSPRYLELLRVQKSLSRERIKELLDEGAAKVRSPIKKNRGLIC